MRGGGCILYLETLVSIKNSTLIYLFFYLYFFFSNIHFPQDSRGRRRPFLTPLDYFYLFHWHLDISQVISQAFPDVFSKLGHEQPLADVPQNKFSQIWRKIHKRSNCREVFCKSQENTYARISFLIKLQAEGLQFIKRKTPGQFFYCEFFKFSTCVRLLLS